MTPEARRKGRKVAKDVERGPNLPRAAAKERGPRLQPKGWGSLLLRPTEIRSALVITISAPDAGTGAADSNMCAVLVSESIQSMLADRATGLNRRARAPLLD